MQRQYHLKKSRSPQQPSQCIVCSLQRTKFSQLTQLCSKILLKKYQAPSFASIQSNTISQLVNYRGSNNVKIIYREAIQLSKQIQMLGECFNFQSIITQIKPLILQRVCKDRYFIAHYHGSAFQMTRKHQLAIKKLSMRRPKAVNSDKKIESQTLTQQIRWQKTDKNGILKKKQQKINNYNQTPSLRRLTRNLSIMVKRYDDNLQFHPSLIFQLMDFAPNHVLDLTKIQKQEIFKKELEQNISIIPTTKYVERLKTVGCELNQEYEENYGLRVKDKILESRKLLRNEQQKGQSKISFLKKSQFEIKENIPPNQRIHTDYESIKFAKSKKKSISNKKSGQKFGVTSIKSLSKKKQNIKALSITKSRVAKKI